VLITLTPLGGTEYILIAEDHSTPFVLQAQDWGNAAWEHTYAGSRGTQGARPAQGTLPNRTVRLQLRLYGQSTDDMAAKQAEVEAVMDALRRRGGWITRRAHGQTHRQHMEVLTTAGLNAGEWTTLTDTRYLLSPILEFVCAPYALGEPMAWTETAATLLPRLVAEVGSLTNVSVSGEVLRITSTDVHLLLDQRGGYEFGDVQMSARIYPGSTSAGDRRWGLILRYIDDDNWLAVTLEQVSGTGYARIRSCIGGAQTVLGGATLTSSLTVHAVEGGWLVGRLDAERVQVQFLAGANPPASPWVTSEGATVTLTGTELTTWGPGTEGRVGVYADPQDANGVGGWHTVRCQPLVTIGTGASPLHKQAFPLRMNIPGTAPALAEVAVTRDNASTGGAPTFGLIGWASRRGGWNRCGMGDFGGSLGTGLTTGWVVSAVTGITAAATSLTAAAAGERATLVLTTTTSSGAAYALADEFRVGRTYRARCEVLLSAGSPVVRLALGRNGDLATSGAITATSAWQEVTVDWTPAADAYGGADFPHVAIRSNSTAGGTVSVRRVRVYELDDPPTLATQTEGRHGRPPLGVVPYGGGGWLVESSSGGTLGYTTSGVSALLPASANMTAISGAGSLAVSCLIDPALAGPDDYAAGSIDVDVWLRAAIASTVVSPRAAVWAMHPRGSVSSDALGMRRMVASWGAAGKPLAANTHYRLSRVGPVSVDIDPGDPAPWRLVATLSWAAGSSGTVNLNGLILVPARARALTPTGLTLSAGGYPAFIGAAGGDGRTITKRVRSDLSGAVVAPPSRGAYGDSGLGGSLIELPTGAVDLLVITGDQVPDDPAPAAANVGHPTHLAVAVSPTPRWGHLRD
jgi:hypothetical protein